jgi:zinc protease
MTEPRADKNIYDIFKTQSQEMLKNRTADPLTLFNDTFTRLQTSNHPRAQPPSLEMLEKTDLNKSLAFYQDRFADAGDFIFIFVGSIDPEVMRPLVETYLGALHNTGRKETWKDHGIRLTPRGIIKETVRAGREPRSSTRIAFTGDFSEIYDIYERACFKVTIQLLQNRLQDVMRESLGGTYNVSVNRLLTWIPVGWYMINIDFSSNPERADELAHVLFSEIKSFKEYGPTENELADVKQAMLREHETGLEQNEYWLTNLNTFFRAGVHPDGKQILIYPDSIKAVTVESAQEAFKKYYDMENYIHVTLLPEELPKK